MISLNRPSGTTSGSQTTSRLSTGPELLFFSCPRDVPILNIVTRTRAEPRHLPGLVREVSRAHHDVCSRWLVRDQPGSTALERALEAAGYAPTIATHASAIGVEQYRGRAADNIVVRQVLDMAGLRDCVAVIDQAFAGGRAFSEQELKRDLVNCTGANARVHRFVAYDSHSGEAVSSGGMTSYSALGFGLFWGGGTIPGARGRGSYSAVVTARINRACELGLAYVGLYAIAQTSAPIVAQRGFRRYGSMTYWDRPSGTRDEADRER